MAAFKPKIYGWANVNYPVPASVVGETCERLEAEYGSVTRENFLEAARDETSPTHSLFEWDDAKAAEKYRVDQSGRILGNLRITVTDDNNEEIQVHAVYNVKSTNEKAQYRSFNVVMCDPDMKSEVLKRAITELNIFRRKYETLEELVEVFHAIDDVLATIENETGGAE